MGSQKGTSEAKSFKAKDLLTNAADTISERGLTHGHYDQTMLRTSKPKRISVAAGFVHMIMSLLKSKRISLYVYCDQ